MTDPCVTCRGPWPSVWSSELHHWVRGERVQDPFYLDETGRCADCVSERRRVAEIEAMPDWIDRARALLMDHHSKEETARQLGISTETLRRWKHCLA